MKLRIVNKGRFIVCLALIFLVAANVLATIQLISLGEW